MFHKVRNNGPSCTNIREYKQILLPIIVNAHFTMCKRRDTSANVASKDVGEFHHLTVPVCSWAYPLSVLLVCPSGRLKERLAKLSKSILFVELKYRSRPKQNRFFGVRLSSRLLIVSLDATASGTKLHTFLLGTGFPYLDECT